MYTDHIENLDDYIVIIDPNIHRKAKLDRDGFLNKVTGVKEIRSALNYSYLSFYITSMEEFVNIRGFYDLVNDAKFSFNYGYSFVVALKPELFYWFKNTAFDKIEKQIVFWLASLYFFVPSKREIMENQIYPILLDEIHKLIDLYYKDFNLPLFCIDPNSIMEYDQDQHAYEYELCIKKYTDSCQSFYGINPPDFLLSPFEYTELKEWGINDRFGIEFIEGYFSQKDWDVIIINGYRDTLQRSESRSDLWNKWKHTYATYDQRKNPIFSFYFNTKISGRAEKKKNIRRRSPISKALRFEILQRDSYKCQYCGRSAKDGAKLSLDHKVPYSDGGTDSYDNLITACMECNSGKGNKVINLEDIN